MNCMQHSLRRSVCYLVLFWALKNASMRSQFDGYQIPLVPAIIVFEKWWYQEEGKRWERKPCWTWNVSQAKRTGPFFSFQVLFFLQFSAYYLLILQDQMVIQSLGRLIFVVLVMIWYWDICCSTVSSECLTSYGDAVLDSLFVSIRTEQTWRMFCLWD